MGSRTDQITFRDTCELLRPVCALGDKNMAILNELFNEFSKNAALLDFPCFLRLIHKVLETNFSDIKRRTNDAAATLGRADLDNEISSGGSGMSVKRTTVYHADTKGLMEE